MPSIKHMTAREILDSRGNPTIEVDVLLSDGALGRAAVPSGASTGSHEAKELRDGEKRYGGKGVRHAVAHVITDIAPLVIDRAWTQRELDEAMIVRDGTADKSKLGANAILGVSLAFAHATAQSTHRPLYRYFNDIAQSPKLCIPLPLMNILNGGRHAHGSTDIQEFMIVPVGATTFSDALRWGVEVFYALKALLVDKGFQTTVGDEGGFAPTLERNEAAIELILDAIAAAGFSPGTDIAIALDAAASEFFEDGSYYLKTEQRTLTTERLVSLYAEWVKKYPIVSIEDGLHEDDWGGYAMLTRELGKHIQIVGDDLFATNTARLERGVACDAGNAILIKLNQVGTVTEATETITRARRANFASVVSHRSGETEDTSIADFAVGLGIAQIKTGAPCRSERTAKYNQLLRIEEELGADALFAGNIFRAYK